MPTVPPRPAKFDPETPPPGFEKRLISFWRDRPIIQPRLQLVHTNGAPREGSIEASFNWANQPGSGHTIPQFQIDRSGRGAMLLPLNRKGIANYKAADFSTAIETADRGYDIDPYPAGSFFTDAQAESVALALAYTAWGFGIPIAYPARWDGSGTASHTEPFGYPYWTNSNGKACPGDRKKQQMRTLVMPRAREILSAWTTPSPPPPPPPPSGSLPDPFPTGDDMLAGIFDCTVNGGAGIKYMVYTNGKKHWIPDEGMFNGAKTLCALNGLSQEVGHIDDQGLFAAMGLVEGPNDPVCDQYGNKVR